MLQVAKTESLTAQLGESQNRCVYLTKQLDELREDIKTVLHVGPVRCPNLRAAWPKKALPSKCTDACYNRLSIRKGSSLAKW